MGGADSLHYKKDTDTPGSIIVIPYDCLALQTPHHALTIIVTEVERRVERVSHRYIGALHLLSARAYIERHATNTAERRS